MKTVNFLPDWYRQRQRQGAQCPPAPRRDGAAGDGDRGRAVRCRANTWRRWRPCGRNYAELQRSRMGDATPAAGGEAGGAQAAGEHSAGVPGTRQHDSDVRGDPADSERHDDGHGAFACRHRSAHGGGQGIRASWAMYCIRRGRTMWGISRLSAWRPERCADRASLVGKISQNRLFSDVSLNYTHTELLADRSIRRFEIQMTMDLDRLAVDDGPGGAKPTQQAENEHRWERSGDFHAG